MANGKHSKRKNNPQPDDVPAVRVRMFRQGLGDCFLVTFDVGRNERHMLIDCGTLGKKSTAVEIDDIADDIFESLGPDGRLDIVVATHEHEDHLSGFRNKALRKLKGKVDHVWLAWTEDPEDEQARKIAKAKQDVGQALAAIVEAQPQAEVSHHVRDLLAFAGDLSAGPLGFASTVNDAMEFVRTGLGGETAYFKPGALITEEWLPGFRIYVLGPPRDAKWLKELGEHGSEELYGLQKAAELRAVLAMDGPATDADPQVALDLARPFDQQFSWRGKAIKRRVYPRYCSKENQWRAIDDDWLSIASRLALQLDSLTNNTSLVMAIERIADGRVLLFPGDAQLGSWLSWHESQMQWTVADAAGEQRTITTADLIARTVFYKVGHHASHNATAREKGLELMVNQSELTAFIPVDRELALTRNPKGSWQMPAPLLYRSLLEKCQGRVVRSDLGWARKPKPGQNSESQFGELGSEAKWKEWARSQAAAKHVKIEVDFAEYRLE